MGIQLLKKHGFSLKQIAREAGCAVNTIRRQLAKPEMPKFERKLVRPTKLVAYET